MTDEKNAPHAAEEALDDAELDEVSGGALTAARTLTWAAFTKAQDAAADLEATASRQEDLLARKRSIRQLQAQYEALTALGSGSSTTGTVRSWGGSSIFE